MKQLDLFDIGIEHSGYLHQYGSFDRKPHTFIVQYKNEEGRTIREYYRRSQDQLARYVWSRKASRLVIVW